jgi:hypothetical protein
LDRLQETGDQRPQLKVILAQIDEDVRVRKVELDGIANKYVGGEQELHLKSRDAAKQLINEMFTQRARRAQEFEIGSKLTPS